MADLSALNKTLFQTQDEKETQYLFLMIGGFEKGARYPRAAFYSGEAAKHLRPHFLAALGETAAYVEADLSTKRVARVRKRRNDTHGGRFMGGKVKPRGVKLEPLEDDLPPAEPSSKNLLALFAPMVDPLAVRYPVDPSSENFLGLTEALAEKGVVDVTLVLALPTNHGLASDEEFDTHSVN